MACPDEMFMKTLSERCDTLQTQAACGDMSWTMHVFLQCRCVCGGGHWAAVRRGPHHPGDRRTGTHRPGVRNSSCLDAYKETQPGGHIRCGMELHWFLRIVQVVMQRSLRLLPSKHVNNPSTRITDPCRAGSGCCCASKTASCRSSCSAACRRRPAPSARRALF